MNKLAKFALYLGYGLAPLWVITAYVVFDGYRHGNTPEYWSAAPWMILLSAAASAITWRIATATINVYEDTVGVSAARRAAARFILLNVLIVAIFAGLWMYERRADDRGHNNEALAVEFVRNHPQVIQAVGPPKKAFVTVGILKDGRPLGYEISVTGTKTISAIVDIDLTTDPPRFVLACLSSLWLAQRDSNKDPCAP